MKRIITLLIGIFYLTTNLHGQDLGYDNNSRWFWGLNAGGTWQTTDVKNRTDFGFGFTVGRSLNYDYGKKVSFDIRARGLFGNWIGQDKTRSGFTIPNEALSSGETNYKDSLGFAFRNFNTAVSRLSIELVMHFNSVRENTKIDPYIFGGIGYTWYRAKGNYLNDDSQMYDFASWGEKLNKTEYDELQDISYETILDGSSSGKRNVQLMPSAGFGVGYQFAPRFSMGIEHKTTFTGLDNFDGLVNQNSLIKNDWYHYTSLYLRFYVKTAKRNRTNVTTNSSNYTPDRNDEMQPPRVVFTNPSSPGTTTNVSSYGVRADIFNVYDRQDVTFSHNGNKVSTFTYNPSTRKFESQVNLTEGENTFEVSGRNVYGLDRQTTTIIYKKPDPVPPIVSFQNPPYSPIIVTSNVFELDATVLNVDQKSQVRMQLNGTDVNNFTFNATSKKTRATLNLNYGNNVVQLTGTNIVGMDSKTTIIIFNRESATPTPNIQPPVVYFVNPASNPYTANTATMNLDAKVLYVLNKQNVTFKQNGQINNNFNFNPNSQDFRSSVSLVNGQNVFEIIGVNKDGSSQATTIIIYQRQTYNPPIVTITNPNTNPYAADREDLNFSATVLNVSSKNQVEVKVNGQVTSNFTFTNSTVYSTIRLAGGTTVIEVKGTNQDGVDQKQTTVTYRKPVSYTPRPPVVTITNPNVNPYTSTQALLSFSATVLNVSSKDQVEVKVNGQIITNFTFINSIVQASIRLSTGTNTLDVKGTNADGSDSKSTTVVYTSIPKPVIVFTNPARCPASFKEGYQEIRGTVSNVNSVGEVAFNVGGNVVENVKTELVGGKLMFTIPITVSVRLGDISIQVTVENAGGKDTKSCVVKPIKPVIGTVVSPVKPDIKPVDVKPTIVIPQSTKEPTRKPTIRVPAPTTPGGSTRENPPRP